MAPAEERSRVPEEERVKILFVDDEPWILALLERLLARENFQVLLAESGHEGLASPAT